MKNFTRFYYSTFLLILCLGFSQVASSQIQATMAVRGTINSFGNDAMTYRSTLAQTWMATVQATTTNASAGFLFANNGSFSPKWANGSAVSFNSKSTWFASGADGTYNQTNGNFYTFICQDQNGGTNSQGYVFQTSAAPVSVSTVAQSVLASSVTVGQAVTITATTSASLPTGQGVFLRYSTNAFSTSTVVNMTGSGSTYTAAIPSGTNTAGANVVYYVFTSGGTTPPAAADCDLSTINLNNNGGSNYSYTVNTPAVIYGHDFGTTTIASHPYTVAPGTFNANLSSSSWANNTSTTWTSFAGSAGQAIALSSISTANVWTLTFNVASGFSAAVTSFSFWRQSSQSTNTWSMTINGTAVGSGTIPTVGAVNTVNPVTNLVAGLTGTVTVVITLGGTLTGSLRIDDFTLNGNVVSQPGPPILTTPTATVTGTTTATLGANITSNGGAAITARGTSWKISSPVVATDNQVAEGGTATGVYTQARTGFSAQTQYFYRGYATNANGTATSAEGNFRTWSNPATAQPATFATTAGSSSLVATWATATFPGSGATQAGYAVIYSTGTPTLSSANGTAPTAGVGTLINITPTVLPTTPALTTTISGLVNGTLYNLLIIPYTWDGTNASTYNYFTTGALTTSGTPAAISYTWNGGAGGAWATTTNWTPNSQVGGPAGGDSVTFNLGTAMSVTSVPTVTLGSITITGTGSNVTLASASTANTVITLSNATTALSIANGTTLNLIGHTTSSRLMSLVYTGVGNTATIAGTLNLQTSGSGAASYTATNSTTTVSGTMITNSTLNTVASTSSNLIVSQTGTFQLLGTALAIPTVAWNSGTPGATLRLSQTSAAVLTGLSGVTFQNVTVDGSSTLTLNSTGSASSWTIARNYTQTSGTTAIDFATGAGTTNISIGGSFQKTVGTMNTSGAASNGTITFIGTTASLQCNSSQWTNFIVATNAICSLNGAFVTNSNSSATSPTSFTVNASGTLNCGTNVLSGSTTAASNSFVLIAGATLGIGSTVGITSSGLTGNIQTIIRTFSTTANYVYNGVANQVTGNGLPATVNTLTINNTGVSNKTVTLSGITAITATASSLTLTAGLLDLNTKQLTIPTGGNIVATTGDFTATAGPVYFIGTGTVSGTVNFPTLRLSGGVNFGSASNVVTSMLMESGSFVTTNAPTYGSASTLIYNTTGTYGRNLEWSATSGKGYPNHVLVQNGTTVDLSANGFADRAIAGDLNLGVVGAASAGSLSMGATTNKLTVGGNVVIGGNTSGTSTLTLSSAIGGDIYVTGNWDRKVNGAFASSSRAVFFEGAGTSTITTITAATFDFLFISKTSGGTVSLANDINVTSNLTLNSQIVTNAFKVIIPTGNNVTANANGWVRGNLQKNIPTGTNSRTFEIGSSAAYTPVTTAYSSVGGAGNITVSTTNNDHPQIGSSTLVATKTVNRFYSIANSGVTGGSYDATFTFVAGDVDSGVSTSVLGIANYVNPTWTNLTIGARTSTTTQATGVTVYGDFQLGEGQTTWTAGASTTAWATSGNWSNGVPTLQSNVFVASASFYPEITTTVTANSLDVAASTSLTVKSGGNITLTDKINNAGTITVENNANLRQVNATANTGSGSTIVKRNTAALMRQDYVMWSSPVSGQQLQAFSPLTLSTRFYVYDYTVGGGVGNYAATSATGNFVTGTGYLIRLPNNHPVTATIWNGQFTGGNANNGLVDPTLPATNKYYSIGNPYASTISADDFITSNSLNEAIYFWRKSNNAATSSYATYTLAGGVSNSGGDPLLMIPNGFIQVGQGFIAKLPSPATKFTFTNSLRVINNGDQFFRRLEDRSRYWLNLTNDQGFFGQMMVAYMPNATNGYDPAIDGLFFNDSATSLTSTIENQDYIIQGRALPFEATDVVALGFKSELAGTYTIALNSFDGTIFETQNQAIYLKDNLTNTTQDLRAGAYTFATEPGVFNNRFEVRYENLLSVENPSLSGNTVAVYKQNQEVVVNAGNIKLSKVQIYDIRGRLLTEKNNINNSEVRLNAGVSNQVILVKITSANNEVVTKKVVN